MVAVMGAPRADLRVYHWVCWRAVMRASNLVVYWAALLGSKKADCWVARTEPMQVAESDRHSAAQRADRWGP